MKYLIIIIIIAASFRFYNLNWDSGFHLHPDERMIALVTEKISFEDLNPHFFAYGSFPIYLLKITGTAAGIFNSRLAVYDSINLVGRFLSTLFDLGTIVILFLLGKKIFDQKVGLLAAFFYAVAVLPIQLSHFYAVDTPLTFFIIITLYFLISYWQKSSLKNIFWVGIFFGLALATKISAIVLIIPIILTFIIQSIIRKKLFIVHCSLFMVITALIFTVTMPHALLDFQEFSKQTLQQQAMTKSAWTFPYTLQYVGKIPYFYELKNIFFWGLGPILATICLGGTVYLTLYAIFRFLNHKFSIIHYTLYILLSFFWLYFAIVGHFAIGFMRYLLPLYPLLCLFGAFFIFQLLINLKFHFSPFILYTLYFILLIWPLAFLSIYSQPNTRVQASEWIYQNIPSNSVIAREHWDDGLPLENKIPYQFIDLPIYDMQNPVIEAEIYQKIASSDYIIIASNRLYTPLQRIAKNCQIWQVPKERCSTKAAFYYDKLFANQLGFKKVAEFSIQPKISILNCQRSSDRKLCLLSIDDSSADESFTVYDHPKVMIFKKTSAHL